jgi:hypothetical protein
MLIGAAIAIGIGLSNLALAEAFSHNEPVAFAAALTILLVIVATLMSRNSPDPEDSHH